MYSTETYRYFKTSNHHNARRWSCKAFGGKDVNRKLIAPYLYLLVQVLFPLMIIPFGIAGWNFRFAHPYAFVFEIVAALISIILVIAIRRKKRDLSIRQRKLLCTTAEIGLVSWLIFLLTSGIDKPWGLIPVVVLMLCHLVVLSMGMMKRVYNILCGIISVPLVLFAIFCLFMYVVFMDFGAVNTLREFPSPNGRYIASVVDFDEGALGGSTDVDVRIKKIGAFDISRVFQIEKNIFRTGWGVGNDIEVEWKGNEILLINGEEYAI